jgi:3-dehydroquinate synthase
MTPTKRALLVLMCALLVPIVPFAMIGELPGERWLNSAGSDSVRFGITGAGLLALDLLLPIPSSIIGALLGGRLGFVAGGLWCFLGLFVGHCTGYALGRLTPERWTSSARGALGRSSGSWIALLLSRPIPVFAEALALTAGAERMPLSAFVVSVAIGDAIYAAALAADGAALLPEGTWGIGLLLPMLLPVVGYLAWRKLVVARAL